MGHPFPAGTKAEHEAALAAMTLGQAVDYNYLNRSWIGHLIEVASRRAKRMDRRFTTWDFRHVVGDIFDLGRLPHSQWALDVLGGVDGLREVCGLWEVRECDAGRTRWGERVLG